MTVFNSPNSPHDPARRALLGWLLALPAVLMWGTFPVVARYLALEGVAASVVVTLRVAIGGVVLGLWLLASAPQALRSSLQLLRNRWVWAAMLCYGVNMLVFHQAIGLTSAAAVMMLENIAPVVALFGGVWLFRERITGRALLALVLALGGVILVCLAKPGVAVALAGGVGWGNLLAIAAGLTWGCYTLACRGMARGDDSLVNSVSGMMVTLLGSAVLLLPLLIGQQGGWPATPTAWVWLFLLGALPTALATVLWRMALSYLSAYTASLIFLLTIVLTMGTAALFLHEWVTPLMLLGATGIVAALLTVVKTPREEKTETLQG